MKIKHLFLSVLAMASVAVACDKENQNSDKPSLKLDPATVEFEATAGTKTVKVEANQAWAIDGNDYDWVTLSQEEGDGAADIEVTVLANSGLERTAKITFRCSIVKKTLTIKQTGEGKIETITVEEFIKKADTENFYTLSGTVSGFNSKYCSFDLTDATGKIYVYSVTDASKTEYSGKIANGGKVVVSGKYKYFDTKSQHEVVEATILSYEAGETPDYTKAEAKTVKDFIAAADANTYYKLTGKTSGFNSQYCSFDITDETGKIYVYSVANKADWAEKLGNDITVTLAGKYLKYEKDGNVKDEVVDAYIISIDGDTPNPPTPPTPGELTKVTIKEFLEKPVSTTDWYQLTGKIVSIAKSDYGNFTIADETGEVFIYGMTSKASASNDKSFGSLGLAVNDIVTLATLRAEHNGTPQGGGDTPAYYISHEKGEAPKPDGKYFTKVTSADNLGGKYLIVYEASTTEAYVFNGQDAEGNYAKVAITDKGIASDENIQRNSVTIATMDGGYSIQLNSGKYICGIKGSNKLNFADAASANTIGLKDASSFEVISNETIFTYNSNTSNGNRFRYYKSATVSGQPKVYKYVQLYKLAE